MSLVIYTIRTIFARNRLVGIEKGSSLWGYSWNCIILYYGNTNSKYLCLQIFNIYSCFIYLGSGIIYLGSGFLYLGSIILY